MSSPADPIIAALRTGHDSLVAFLADVGDDVLTGPSGCADWDLSQVVSHLGSGAEISLASLRRSLEPGTAAVDNNQVWDRWNAASPQQRAADFPIVDEALVSAYEALDDNTRNTLRIDLGFLPEPVDVATAADLRLGEFALHSWDIRVAFDPAATVAADAAAAHLDGTGLLLGWIGKADQVRGPVTLTVRTSEPERTFGLRIDQQVAMTDAPGHSDGTLRLPAEAWLRLTTGRLDAGHTPASVVVDSAVVTLEELRRVFPGY